MMKIILTFVALLTVMISAFAQLGSFDKDLVYTPVTPCRIFDTRASQGGTGPIGTNGTKTFAIWGQNTYSNQGGKSGNCGVTAGSNTAAVALSMAVVSPSAAGYLTAYPTGETQPTAATMNFNTGEVVVSNSAILKVSQTNGNAALSIFASSSTEVIADVVGYYAKPVSLGSLECVNTTPVTNTINQGPENGFYHNIASANDCAAGYTAIALNCTTNNMIYAWAVGSSVSSVSCGGLSTASGYSVSASLKCCRIPGR